MASSAVLTQVPVAACFLLNPSRPINLRDYFFNRTAEFFQAFCLAAKRQQGLLDFKAPGYERSHAERKTGINFGRRGRIVPAADALHDLLEEFYGAADIPFRERVCARLILKEFNPRPQIGFFRISKQDFKSTLPHREDIHTPIHILPRHATDLSGASNITNLPAFRQSFLCNVLQKCEEEESLQAAGQLRAGREAAGYLPSTVRIRKNDESALSTARL